MLFKNTRRSLLFVSLIFLFSKEVTGDEYVTIKNVNDYTAFLNGVNQNGTSYKGTTVLLDSDLSLSGVTESIGIGPTRQFRGTFDGQGHTISNYKFSTTTSEYAGLFGCSLGMSVRNVVLDSTCVISSMYNSPTDVTVGSIVGVCYASGSRCVIENTVNLGNVGFSAITGRNQLYLGGIAGWIHQYPSYDSIVKNCANYGSVVHSGSGYWPIIGGLVGNMGGYNHVYVENCANHGIIIFLGESNGRMEIGGIMGNGNNVHLDNCVSNGKIFMGVKPSYTCNGAFMGYGYRSSSINNCYFSENVDVTKLWGDGIVTNLTDTPSTPTTVDLDLVNKMNSRVTAGNGWNRWVHNKYESFAAFKVNDYNGFRVKSKIITLPNIVAYTPSYVFDGWYNDPSRKYPLRSDEISGSTLFAAYGPSATAKSKGGY